MDDPFGHHALFYRGDQEYVDGTVPFLEEGLAAGEPVAAAVPGPRLTVLRAALGGTVERVRLVDMAEDGRNPARIIPGVLRAFADAIPTSGCGSSASRSGPAARRANTPPASSTRR